VTWLVEDYFPIDKNGRHRRTPHLHRVHAFTHREAITNYVLRHADDSWETKDEVRKAAAKMVKVAKRNKVGDIVFHDTYLPGGDWVLRLREV
jgi:hypothetical protein